MRELLGLLLLAGCATPEPRELRLELVPKRSCGATPANYDTTCVRELEIRVLEGNGGVLASECTVVAYSSIYEMVASREMLSVLDAIEARPSVRIELRGYATYGGACEAAPSEDNLMYWGSSEVVDLTDELDTVINVDMECRPDCDCADIEEATCLPDLELGVCGPVNVEYQCQRLCTDQLVDCVDGLCDACSTTEPCSIDMSCVHRVEGTAVRVDENVCLPQCPRPGTALPCPTRHTTCRRLDGTRYTQL